MSDLKKVKSGEALHIPARAYNAMVDAALDYRNRQQNRSQQITPGQSLPTVLIKNSSGSDVGRFAVLGIEDVLYDPATDLDAFKRGVVFVGVTPTTASHTGKFVITAEPIANGKVGRAYASGLCHARINVTDESHGYAEVADGEGEYLASGESGTAAILWKQSGTGTKWATIRFGGGGGIVYGEEYIFWKRYANHANAYTYNGYKYRWDTSTGTIAPIYPLTSAACYNIAEVFLPHASGSTHYCDDDEFMLQVGPPSVGGIYPVFAVTTIGKWF